MKQGHTQIEDQVDHRSRPFESAALGKSRNIAFHPMDGLHQPSHGGYRSTQQQGGHVKQQPRPLDKNRPAALGVGDRLTLGQFDQQVAVGQIERCIDVNQPEFGGEACRLYPFRQQRGIDNRPPQMRLAESTIVVDASRLRRKPIKNAVL
ncbi:hypothetical protein D3C77_345290 [compost metagenome]